MTDNIPPCPHCGGALDTETVYTTFKDTEYKYACNSDLCAATVWTEEGWKRENDMTTMLAQYE